MKRVVVTIVLTVATLDVDAQYNGPAVEACRAYAKQEAARDGTRAKDIVFERDQNLQIERYTRKLGNQFVSSILRGNGAVCSTARRARSSVHLPAGRRQARGFLRLRRAPTVPGARAMQRATARCATSRGRASSCCCRCRTDLTQSYAQHFQRRAERSQCLQRERRHQLPQGQRRVAPYRDAECARRRDHAPKGVASDDHHLACMVELTGARAWDMR